MATLQNRIHKLLQHGDFDPELVAAVLDISADDVHHALRDNTFEPTDGSVRVLTFPFTFDTPGLATGIPIYLPAVGEVLYDAWVSVLTVWDSSGTAADVLAALGSSCFASPIDLAAIDDPATAAGGLRTHEQQSNGYSGSQDPAVFTDAEPLQLVVTVGEQPTQGEAVVYLVVATPAMQPVPLGQA